MKSPELVLKSLIPMLLVLIVLIVGVVVMPTITADPRSRASEPKKTITAPNTTNPRPTFSTQSNSIKPEIACSDLYSPVCDSAKGITYPNECEAGKAMATKLTKGECAKTIPITLPSTN
jgi:hypothetical protein